MSKEQFVTMTGYRLKINLHVANRTDAATGEYIQLST